MAKKELIPAKQEKAHERLKNFRTELADYRQSFDRFKKDREDSVRLIDAFLQPSERRKDSCFTIAIAHMAVANGPKPHRTSRSAPAPYRNAREPLFAIQPPPEFSLCSF